MGVPVQLCQPGLSQTGEGILWPYDRHPGWWQTADHADYGQRPDNSDWSPAYDFFGMRPHRENKSHSQINIGAFAPMHRFLAKVVVTNLWPQTRWSELSLKKATLLYAIVMQTPFCLCKHILHTMLKVWDEKNTSLSFGRLITQICLQVVTDISDFEPRSWIPDPFSIQTLIQLNAQLWHEA
jgi:hypothetical protein